MGIVGCAGTCLLPAGVAAGAADRDFWGACGVAIAGGVSHLASCALVDRQAQPCLYTPQGGRAPLCSPRKGNLLSRCPDQTGGTKIAGTIP